jgi:hypothetical protein
MADQLDAREHALRTVPLPYSLALRLRDAGVAAEVISEYLDVEEAALDGVYQIAEAKLAAALDPAPSPPGDRPLSAHDAAVAGPRHAVAAHTEPHKRRRLQ